jgi:hypothetical protein
VIDPGNFIIKEIDGETFVLNRKTGHIGLLNDNAGLIVNCMISGLAAAEIADELSARFGLDRRGVLTEVNRLKAELTAGSGPAWSECEQVRPEQSESGPDRGWTGHYELNRVVFRVEFPTQRMFAFIDRLFSLFRVSSVVRQSRCTEIAIRKEGDRFDVIVDGVDFASVREEHEAHGMLRGILIRNAYQGARHWAMLHAGSVGKDSRALVLAAPTGSGKRTLALAFAYRGFEFYGDDTIGIDLEHNEVLPFPTLLSIKEGAWTLFEGRNEGIRTEPVYVSGNRRLRLIRPPATAVDWASANAESRFPSFASGSSVSAILFIDYQSGAAAALTELELAEALKWLNDSGAVFHPEDIEGSSEWLLHWLKSVPRFHLVHDDLGETLNLIEDRFWSN